MGARGGERAISTLDPGFQPFAAALFQLASQIAPGVYISSARRSRREQLGLIARARAGRSRYPAASHSLHERGLALDLGGVSSAQLRALGEVWEYWGGRWGGRFRKRDPIHFDPGFGF